MTVFITNQPMLDPKQCWDDWVSLGSLTKVRENFRLNNVYHPITGNPPTISAIQKAAYLWATTSHETLAIAKERFEYECKKRGKIPTDEMWGKKAYMMCKLLYYQRPNKLKEHVEKFGLQAYAD